MRGIRYGLITCWLLGGGCVDYEFIGGSVTPEASILAPLDGFSYRENWELAAMGLISISGRGKTGLYRWCVFDPLEVSSSGPGACADEDAAVIAEGSYKGDSMVRVRFPPAAGSWTLQLEVESPDGSSIAWDSMPLLVVEDKPPEVDIERPVNGQVYSPRELVYLVAQVADDVSPANRLEADIEVDGVHHASATPDHLGQVLRLFDFAPERTGETTGWTEIRVVVTDEAGSSSTATVTICLDEEGACEEAT